MISMKNNSFNSVCPIYSPEGLSQKGQLEGKHAPRADDHMRLNMLCICDYAFYTSIIMLKSIMRLILTAILIFTSTFAWADLGKSRYSFETLPVGIIHINKFIDRRNMTFAFESIRGDFKVGEKINVIELIDIYFNIPRKQRVLTAHISSKAKLSDNDRIYFDTDKPTYTYDVKMNSDNTEIFMYFSAGRSIGIVGDYDSIKYNKWNVLIDIDGDYTPEWFHVCTGHESLQMTIWSGSFRRETKRWGAAYRFEGETMPSCKEKDYYILKNKKVGK